MPRSEHQISPRFVPVGHILLPMPRLCPLRSCCYLQLLPGPASEVIQCDDIFITRPPHMLDHATSTITIDGKLGIDLPKKFPGTGVTRLWPALIRMIKDVGLKIVSLVRTKLH